ncbi:ABC transporter ATP-binding protein [Cellulophaga tyrosinoxydans]|uniref:ABC-type Fe3+/spermidine/putrescine transport systems, ATPase components n=1 Tax=Cellulophaga tyrosinoxydans TaxID=504486 RepID=A0A1W1YXT2_9FLAO|nr:ABC transporter ATP-binding protein [Cellulophaga tyrosinoxydans]SMC40933.1 ABC-type Fe3+/spermidine/putrescine transport systems, ATPase components [Cellulophaga tyrosinoxydans]
MLKVNALSFSYKDETILKNISFHADKGAHISIIGESGCGKSTLLKLLYGILQPNEGTIFWGDNQILGPDYNLVPGEKYMKYLSQDFDLMPFISVEENISQFLSVFYPEELKKRTLELLNMIEMLPFAKTKVKYLSGGQQQRVALARVLAQKPEILLLDEPFSHIDNSRKNNLRRNLFSYLKTEEITCIVASHDTNDILSFADEIIVLKDQHIIAHDTPENLYNFPKNKYVASLFGDVNVIPIAALKPYATIEKSILVYPSELSASDKNGLKIKVTKSFFKGSHYLIEGLLNDSEIILFNSSRALKFNEVVYLNIALETINKRLKE